VTHPLLRHALRLTAIVIAALAWIDPSYAALDRPRIALLNVASGRVAADVRAGLSRRFAISSHRDPSADAWVVVSDDQEAEVPEIPRGMALSLVTPRPPAADLVLESLDVPARIGLAARATVLARFGARGLAGTTSTLRVRIGSVEMGRTTHRWTQDPERFVARFDVLPPRAGPNQVVVDAVDGPSSSRRSRADALIVVEDRPLDVLVFEGRPSWASTFARRALDRDTRFVVTFVSRVSRGVATTARAARTGASTIPTPTTLTATPLGAFHVVIVGAPETLSSTEVAALDAFVRQGGVAILAPDRRPEGAYRSLLSRAELDERLLADATTVAFSEQPELRLTGTELAVLRTPPPGARLLAFPAGRTTGACVWSLAAGAGQLLFVGVLDAWRFQAQSEGRFDAWWQQVVEWVGRGVSDRLSVSIDRPLLPPGGHTRVRVAVRGGVGLVGVEAAVSRFDGGPSASDPSPSIVRLWPAPEADTDVGEINAPDREGVYALTAALESGGGSEARASAPLIVGGGMRRARPDDDRWQAATTVRGGMVATVDDIDHLSRVLEAHRNHERPVERRSPMRSAWWLAPFAACLGAEWWLRRRAGLR